MIILGIETSCDETAAAVVSDKGNILSNVLVSQFKEHEIHGGVVPEIGARAHLEYIDGVIRQAMDEAGVAFHELDGVAATCGPGLIGGVIVGMMAGKAIAASQNKPFIAVNHLEAHALTPRMLDDIAFPYLLLLVSGGHTQLLIVEGLGSYRRIGTTLDDAAGECFDKSAKIMGLPYPGGPNVEKIASECAGPAKALERFSLPRPMAGRKDPDFSFSGLKTAVRTHVDRLPGEMFARADISDLAFSLQTAVSETLADRCRRAMEMFREDYPARENPAFVVSGGVAANTAVRKKLETLARDEGFVFHAPPLRLCGDNGAMIAWTGVERLRCGMRDSLDFAAKPRWPLDPQAIPRHGAGIKA